MTEQPDLLRRRLLVGVPASAALVLSASGAQGAAAPEAVTPPDPRQPQFETNDHVARFYRLARS